MSWCLCETTDPHCCKYNFNFILSGAETYPLAEHGREYFYGRPQCGAAGNATTHDVTKLTDNFGEDDLLPMELSADFSQCFHVMFADIALLKKFLYCNFRFCKNGCR